MKKQQNPFLKGLVCVLYLILILFSPVPSRSQEDGMKQVLILNSYHQGFKWTREETEGAVSVLLDNKEYISVHVEYMDWKNYPTQENLDFLYEYYTYKYQKKKIDLVLTTDDIALDFALKHRNELFSGAPVVFAGVNREGVNTITQGYSNFTGILEPVIPDDAIELALQTNPSLEAIYLVYDNTESAQSTARLAVESIRNVNDGIEIIHLNNRTYTEILEQLKTVKSNSIVYILSHYADREGNTMEFDEFCERASSVCPVPVFHLYDFTVGRGSIGGSMLSGRLQGENAARVALRILNGEKADDIPISQDNTIRRIYDYKELKAHNIPINRIPPDSEVINLPFSFFQTYRREVTVASLVFILLVAFITLLIIYILHQKRTEKTLKENQEELTQLNEELTAAEEELKDQNRQLEQSRKELTELAYHDYLTNLPNRLSLKEYLDRALMTAGSPRYALFFIDTDNFKYINDSLGHSAGDQLLVMIGNRLKENIMNNGMLFRFGGDEFIIINRDMTEEEVKNQADALINAFKKPFELNFSVLHISISIGITTYPEAGTGADDLIRSGDIAMYHAKARGKGQYALFSQYMDYVIRERLSIENHLRIALERHEFLLYYQPQIEIATGAICGFEALIRWASPEMGFVMPNSFIPVAEETQLIIPIGRWALQEACAFAKELQNRSGKPYTISVNVSILQLLQADFADMVIDTLKTFDLKPELLELEITESIFMESYEMIEAVIQKLRNNGIRLALDDFGKGYSSLTYLKNLPINTLKIDKMFMNENVPDLNEESITGSIIAMGLQLGLSVVAEGVELQEQLKYLAKHKCSKYQGYLFSRPVPAEEAIEMAEKKL